MSKPNSKETIVVELDDVKKDRATKPASEIVGRARLAEMLNSIRRSERSGSSLALFCADCKTNLAFEDLDPNDREGMTFLTPEDEEMISAAHALTAGRAEQIASNSRWKFLPLLATVAGAITIGYSDRIDKLLRSEPELPPGIESFEMCGKKVTLEKTFADKMRRANEEEMRVNGECFRVVNSYRTCEQQQELSHAVGKPTVACGASPHEQGKAADVDKRDVLKALPYLKAQGVHWGGDQNTHDLTHFSDRPAHAESLSTGLVSRMKLWLAKRIGK